MAYLFDTSVAICLRDGDEAIVSRFAQLDERPFLSVVSKVELEGGVYAKPALTDKRRLAVDALLEILPVIDFDFEMGEAYGQIIQTVGYSRRKVIDRMFAATAQVYDFTLITMNGRDFKDVPGLKVQDWGAPAA